MAAAKQIILTSEGLEKLELELEDLKTVKRRECAEKIKQALSFGDLSENSEYDEAKNEQAQIESRIVQIEEMLQNVKIIDSDEVSTDTVTLGSNVKVFDEDFDEEVTYTIVGSTEADPGLYKISDESPVGAALLGSKVGETVEVEVPQGIIKLKVLEISR